MGREDEIKTIAYRIWEEEGRGDGHDFDHWLMAEAIWEDEQKNETVLTGTKAKSKQTEPQGIHQSLILKMLGR
ncbi:MAG: hypothetical protein A2144_08475 [Chloroflexi bacterium RBG_16_50_9]|nr:MAG: hypothetical protein A2144_08475 [Chloroflexi bacterium RBG_16_50_9]